MVPHVSPGHEPDKPRRCGIMSTNNAPEILMRHLLLAILTALALNASAETDDKAELTELLTTFLTGASFSDPETHERFWADELVYTSSAGVRTDKATILESTRSANADRTQPITVPPVMYSAEDVDIRLYDDVAVVAFRLVATPTEGSEAPGGQYLNTGTFQKRDGEWRAVAWQATVMP